MLKRILLALGGTPFSTTAVRRSIELARAHDAEIVAVTVLDTHYWKNALGSWLSASETMAMAESKPWQAAERRLERVVGEFREACDAAEVGCTLIEPDERPFDALASAWRYADLVIFGLRGLFDYNLVPEPDATIAQLIRQGVRPVFADAKVYRPIRRILIAYSGSMESAKAMKQLVHMRLWPSADVRLACFGKDADEAAQLVGDAAAYLRAHGHTPTTDIVEAPAREALLPYADQHDTDLIVLGDGFRNLLLRDLLGDTMSHVIRESNRALWLSH